MKRSRYTEQQIAYALRQVDGGTPAIEVCRKMGISEQTFYTWRRRYGAMGATELRNVRVLEEEVRRLKHLVADLSLDKHMLQEVLAKKV